ncbi:erythromycin esterase family protein [Dyadobacter sp. 676]|uniref:Erythromycin esterase family protein n=1 Tax=Dyadobacter sp. 676 TaxID=3088362 RepID=A0AAU8FKC9_9BACT
MNIYLRNICLAVLLCTDVAQGQSDGLVRQLCRNAIRLDSTHLSGDENAGKIRQLIGTNFRVLGIGEQSHGTSEFFTARTMFLKALGIDHTLTKIGLEAPMAEVDKLNDYLRGGQGDLKAILRSFRLYGYECREFAELVNDVRRINQGRREYLVFFGFDMQSPFQSLQNILGSGVTGEAADSLKKLLHYYSLLNDEIYNHRFSEADFADLKKTSELIFNQLDARLAEDSVVRKNIANYRQFLLLNDPARGYDGRVLAEIRDSLMAENILSEMKPGEKMVVLAHNAHLQKTPNIFSKSVGFFLARNLKSGYRCVGLTTSAGSYTTFNPKAGAITDGNEVKAGDATTFEHYLSQVNSPVFAFETSPLMQKPPAAQLPRRYRLLVYGLAREQFFEGNLLDDFDYVLHFRQTSGNRSFYLK